VKLPSEGRIGQRQSEIIFGESGLLEKISQEAYFQRFVTMNRDRQSDRASRLTINVMAARHTKEEPPVPLKE
jgi:hypothetical protein